MTGDPGGGMDETSVLNLNGVVPPPFQHVGEVMELKDNWTKF